MSATRPVPPAAVILTHEVTDWATWKRVFDGHEAARKAAGMLGHHINRRLDNPNVISIYMALTDVAKAQAFASSPDLHTVMASAGVKGAPSATWITPVSEHIIWDREVPAALISHRVANFETWLAGYNAAETVRQQGGIIGHAVNRSIDDPNLAIIYHQAASHDALKAFMANPGLKAAMEKSGVVSAPEVTLVTGGWAKMY